MNKKYIYIILILVVLLGGYFVIKGSGLFTTVENTLTDVADKNTVTVQGTTNSNEEDDKLSFTLSDGLELVRIGSYKGLYFEDGSNEKVNNVLAMEIKNTTGSVLQYCEILLTGENGTAQFNISTLYPGETVLALEVNKQKYIDKQDTYLKAEAKNVVFFRERPSFHSDKLVVQALDGALNVKNVSNSVIQGPIYIYYKNKQDGIYLGGITYRCKIDSLAAGELKQGMTSHFNKENSEIMFITIGQ